MATETEDVLLRGLPGQAELAAEQDGYIHVFHARTHNLKNIVAKLPRDALVVITGISGSGKSSLAFDTLYAEGQRRYIESLSSYARQFLEKMPRPDCDLILGLPPTIAIHQEMTGASPRSTVATSTEIYDFLRLLYARAGTPQCPDCGAVIRHQTVEQIVGAINDLPAGTRITLLAPLLRGRKGHYRELFERLRAEGYVRARIDGAVRDLDEVDRLPRYRTHDIEAVVDRLIVKKAKAPQAAPSDSGAESPVFLAFSSRLSNSVQAALSAGSGSCIALLEDGQEMLFSQIYACPRCGRSFEEPNPNTFSFNSPYGRCETCKGLGTVDRFDEGLIVPDPSLSIAQGAVEPWARSEGRAGRRLAAMLNRIVAALSIDAQKPFEKVSAAKRRALLHGDQLEARTGIPASNAVIPSLEAIVADNPPLGLLRFSKYISQAVCPTCEGARLRPESLAVTVDGLSIRQLTALNVQECLEFLEDLKFEGMRAKIAEPIVKEVKQRLRFMLDVGLHYLTLDRRSNSLSRGEFQRIRLATQIGSGLTGVCYVLDEPTIGLHHRDNARLLDSLERLRDAGNTVLVVEHDEATIRRADWVLDLGPGAGRNGGHVVYSGPLEGLCRSPDSLTARYLSGQEEIPIPERRRTAKGGRTLAVRGAREHNLKGVNVTFPLGAFCCVTGVSGSGKSTLVNEILYRALARKLYGSRSRPGAHKAIIGARNVKLVLEIDQSPIGRSPRSCPATYTKVMDDIRRAFADTRQAKVRGYDLGRFSFNGKQGRCPVCQGRGEKEIEMHFLPNTRVTCEECRGARYNEQTLQVTIRGKNVADVLAMTVEEALDFFRNYPSIERRLRTMREVGLDYLTLGQPSTTLSGGEAQRIKLTRELGKVATGGTVYILDEPTTGLHFDDVKKLLRTLHGLADMGNTLVVIEHNLEVIKSADYIIDLGPEGGDEGGYVVACGTPEEIAKVRESHTGRALKPLLERRA
jgi:excinuclease ABC subunit A